MMRLVKRGLMFGNLFEIASPAMVARYNRALEHLTGKQTNLTEFHIDISGYSPEIGHEFQNELYLNPKGCNRQFIIMSTAQKTAPLLGAHFSTSRGILRSYIDDNEDELFALTAREAVSGELLNSVYEITKPEDLFAINQISIEADTIGQHVSEADRLSGKIDTFMNTDDAWWDDVLIAEMIELAKHTGNIQRNPLTLGTASFSQANYYTSHFGGLYIFRDAKTPTVIARQYSPELENLPNVTVISFEDRDEIGKFLWENGFAEMIAMERGTKTAAIVRQKLDFITIATAAAKGDSLVHVTRQHLRNIERQYIDDMPPEYDGLMQIFRWASMGGTAPNLTPDHPAYFYAFRSSQHENRDLINMLLSELSPLDFRQLFICHKDAFYAAYRGWSDAKKEYVAKFLADEYAIDKAGARETLFGGEPEMNEQSMETSIAVSPLHAPVTIRWTQ